MFEDDARLKGGIMPNMSKSTATSVSDLRADFDRLITDMKNCGVMKADKFVLIAENAVDDEEPAHADRTYNTSQISNVRVMGKVILIRLNKKVEELKDYDNGDSLGEHKWLGIAVSAGITPITNLYLNGVQLTEDDAMEATVMGLSEGYFVLWLMADRIIKNASNTFTLDADGYEETEYRVSIMESSE